MNTFLSEYEGFEGFEGINKFNSENLIFFTNCSIINLEQESGQKFVKPAKLFFT